MNLEEHTPEETFKALWQRALEFEQRKQSFQTTSDRIGASREVKALILSLNNHYKQFKEIDNKQTSAEIMDLMKRLTAIKQKIEKRLKGRKDS